MRARQVWRLIRARLPPELKSFYVPPKVNLILPHLPRSTGLPVPRGGSVQFAEMELVP